MTKAGKNTQGKCPEDCPPDNLIDRDEFGHVLLLLELTIREDPELSSPGWKQRFIDIAMKAVQPKQPYTDLGFVVGNAEIQPEISYESSGG